MEPSTNGTTQSKVDEEQARRLKRAALKDLNIHHAGQGMQLIQSIENMVITSG